MFAPVLDTVPQFVPLHPVPPIAQLTDWFAVKQTEAVNVCCPPKSTVAAVGEMETACPQADVIVIDAEADWLESAALVATSVTGFAGGNAAGAVNVAVLAPVLDTVPQLVALQPAPVTLQVTF